MNEAALTPLVRSLPAPLRELGLFGVELWQWLALALLLLVALGLAWIATVIARRALRPALARTETRIDDALLRVVGAPLVLGFSLLFFAAGLPVLALAEPPLTFLRGLLKGIGVATVAWATLRLIDVSAQVLTRRLEREGRRRLATIVPLGQRAAKVFLFVIAVIVLLQNVGLNVTGLIAGVGVGGIAVALAAQKTIENVFGGVSVIADQPVRVGDLCRFRDGRVGTVEEIGLRSTRIRTPDRTLVTIPNADFAQRELENLAARDRIRLHVVIGLRYETTPEQIRAVIDRLRGLVGGHRLVGPETVRVFFLGFGPSALDVEVSAFVDTTDPDEFNAVREELLLSMMETIVEAGAQLAAPSRAVLLNAAPAPAPPA
jgi:MscS family membrane protein